jgi:hypothetical protein
MAVRPFKKLDEFEIWSVGPLVTTHGDNCMITDGLLQATQDRINSLGRRVSIDIHHIASDVDIAPENRKSFGSFLTELRDGGKSLWATKVLWNTPQVENDASAGFYGNYLSQEFTGIDANGMPVADLQKAVMFDLSRVTLTDDPATINAKPLVALSKDNSNKKVEVQNCASTLKKHSITSIIDDTKRIKYEAGKVTTMDPKEFIEALKNAVGQLNAVVNAFASQAPVEAKRSEEVEPEKQLEEDEEGKQMEEEEGDPSDEDVKKLSSTPGQAAASVVAVDEGKTMEEDESTKKLEEESTCEKKMESPAVNAPSGDPESTTVDETKKLSKFLKEMFPGCSADQIQGRLFAMESASKKVDVATKKATEARKLSREAQVEANFKVAVSSGILSPMDESAVKRFKKMSITSQRAAIDSAPSFFTKKVQAGNVDSATEEAAKKLSKGTSLNGTIMCKTPFDKK